MADKIAVTREEVLSALSLPNVGEMHTMADVARWVVTRVHGVEHVYDGKSALWYVERPAFKRLLADMVDDGSLVLRTGEEWFDNGAPSHLGTWNGRYYVLPEKAREWGQAHAERIAAKRRQEADQYAKGFLVERHREEYEGLVAEYLADVERETSK